MSAVASTPSTSRRIRTLHVIVPEPEGSVGGADTHVRDLAAAQAEMGTTSPVVFEMLSPSFAGRVRAAGVECVSVAGQGRSSTLRTLRGLLSERRIDVVHAHGYDGTWWAVAAWQLVRPRPALVITCHGWIDTTIKYRFMSTVDRAVNRLADGIIVVSDELIPVALRFSFRARAFAVIPNGVRILPLQEGTDIRRQLGIPERVPLVGAVGRLSTEKRHDIFVEACGMVGALRADVQFVLAGGGRLRQALRRQADAAGLAHRFHLVGVVDRPEALLRQFEVVVQPSDVETTSRVVMEAMSQARPVVATQVGGMELLIRDGVDGVLVATGSPRRIAAEVLRLLEQPHLASQLGEAARLTACSHFDAREMAAAVDDVYAAVLGRNPLRPQTWVRHRVCTATRRRGE